MDRAYEVKMPGMSFTLGSHPFGNGGMHVYLVVGVFIGVAMTLLMLVYLSDESNEKVRASNSMAPRFDEAKSSTQRRMRLLTRSFGALWIVDGVLQLRDAMPSQFVASVINPAFSGAPYLLKALGHFAGDLWNIDPVKADLGASFLQITIGAGLLFLKKGRSWRFIVKLSIVWSLAIFIFGNGFGLFYQAANSATGAPSAVLLYLFASIELLKLSKAEEISTSNRRIGLFVGSFFIVGTLLSALTSEGYWSKDGYYLMIKSMASSKQPQFLSELLDLSAKMVKGHGTYMNAAVILIGITIALLLFLMPDRKLTASCTFGFGLLTWIFLQDFGVFSPTGTDFNTGLPLMLLAIALYRDSTEMQAEANFSPHLVQGVKHPTRWREVKV